MTIAELINQLRRAPETIEFDQVMATITEYYDYTPVGFSNGDIINAAGNNEGSCKIFAFAQLNALSEMETLALFGKYYREDVMENPSGDDHANIRNFILDGWLGIKFDDVALVPK
ncbi:MAG: HopJ type III effector protein [Spongiibacteraceae bacterium]